MHWRWIAAWTSRRFRRPLLPILKIPLPALNNGAGRERLFVLDRTDSQNQLFGGHRQASRGNSRGVVTFRSRQLGGKAGRRRYWNRRRRGWW